MENIKIGDGVTFRIYTDRFACTVTRVSKSGKTFWCREDKATRIDNNGMSETQEYSYEADPNGREHRVSLRKDGTWRSTTGYRAALGVRAAYHDFSF